MPSFHPRPFRLVAWMATACWLAGGQAAAQERELTLQAAVDAALSSHPALRAAAARIESAGALRTQAGLRPNPTATIQTENWRFTGTPSFSAGRDLDAFAYVTQTMESAGKREKRGAAAGCDVEVARSERAILEWRIRQDIRHAYARALQVRRELELLRESGNLFDQVIEYTRVRLENGVVAEADLIRVQLERERLIAQENATAVEADKALTNLLRAMGITDLSARFRLTELDPARTGGSLSDEPALRTTARRQRAEIAYSQAILERARAELELQRANSRPDWSVVFGYKRTAGYNAILGGVSVPIPVFDRKEGQIASAIAEVDRAGELLKVANLQVEGEVASALSSLRRRKALMDQVERGLFGRAEESWKIALAAYREGGTDLLQLLDASGAETRPSFCWRGRGWNTGSA
jgi:outer membrane protein, heavy metal efflux system